MELRINGEVTPTHHLTLGVFAWDRNDSVSDVEVILYLNGYDLIEFGGRLKALSDTWLEEDPEYYDGNFMEGVPRPTSADLFVSEPDLLKEYLRYDSFWHGDAGHILLSMARGGATNTPRFLATRFIRAGSSDSGAIIVLGAIHNVRAA